MCAIWRNLHNSAKRMKPAVNHTIDYRPEIDGLRAVAVISVMLFHAGVAGFSGGFVGVDVFFVISGFLITSILVKEHEQGRFSVMRFYERRARRILPALALVIVVCMPFAWFLLLPDQLKQSAEALISVATFSSNIYFWRTTDYFSPPQGSQLLLHTWSLAVEEQYYLVFPVFLLLCWRFGKKKLAGLLACVAVISIAIAEWGRHHHPVANFYLLPSRSWELMFGAILAIVPTKRLSRLHSSPLASNILSMTGLALVVYAVVVFDQTTAFPGAYVCGPVLGAVLIIAAATNTTFVGKLLSTRPFVSIGLISYSAYLWHQPLLGLTRIAYQSEPPMSRRIIMLALSLILAAFSYRFVETPFRKGKKQLGSPKVLGWAAACLLVFIGTGAAVVVSDGWPSRYPAAYQKVDWNAITAGNYGLGKSCDYHDQFVRNQNCTFGDHPRVVLWGDSFAMHLASGLKQAQVGFIQATKANCGPSFYVAPVQYSAFYDETWASDCMRFTRSVKAFLKENSASLKWVIVASPFEQYVDGLLYDGKHVRNLNAEERVAAFTRTINDIRAMGLMPVLVMPPPNPGNDIDTSECIHRLAAGFPVKSSKLHADCSFDEALNNQVHKDRNDFVRKIVDATGVQTVSLQNEMCSDGRCPASMNGIPLYRDGAHLSEPGAALLEKTHNTWKKLFGSSPNPD